MIGEIATASVLFVVAVAFTGQSLFFTGGITSDNTLVRSPDRFHRW